MSVMAAEPRTSEVQVVGTGGEVALGKEYAGRSVLIETLELEEKLFGEPPADADSPLPFT